MNFNKHYDLNGRHAFLSGSKYHWINYDEEKLAATYEKYLAVQKGTELHAFAAEAIRLKQKLKGKTTISMYVNDAIGYGMVPEQILYYSDNCFGTADAISFKKRLLRIHDLKTGETPASIHQLEVYDAIFCLEYDIQPGSIDHELRIYQSDQVLIHEPEIDDIAHIMDRIVVFDKRINEIKWETL